ncbi:hypothetical protein [uncultured Bdellovibrio sp.]|uniref:hypothetical protein n=1 Tax=Bdellovibrio sp. HCB-162 TaxID=3394234 RepID=UPI0025CEB311|nr:hypothetical protein [uncultured Bdellovibrio sp.]
MRLSLVLITLLGSSLALAQSLQTSASTSTYHTSLIKTSEMHCEARDLRKVITAEGKVLTRLCAKQYRACMIEGSCLIEDASGKRIGISYHKYDAEKNQSYFNKTDLKKCGYGYGFGKVSDGVAGLTCLIPYFTVSGDPLAHALGDVIYIPELVGVALPTGQTHDGYVIIGDYDEGYIDVGEDYFAFFTGTESDKDAKNAFTKLGLSNPSNTFKYESVSEEKAKEIRAKRGFTVLKTFKKTFKARVNPMLESQN